MDAATLAAAKAYANKRLNWRGAWAATTAYAKNDLVTYNGGLYRAPTAFTSGASFVIGNWVELVQQAGSYVPRFPPLELMPMYVFGDSYAQGGPGADNGTRYWDRIASRFRPLSMTNRGVSGTRADQILMNQIVPNWVANSRGFIGLGDVVINDVRQFGATDYSTTREAFRSMLVYLTAKALLVAASDAAFLFGPNWTAQASSTSGAYVDFEWTGDTAYLLVSFTTAAGSLTITNSGYASPTQTVTTGGYQAPFTGAIKLAGYGAGNHAVRVKVVSGTITVIGAAIPSSNPPSVCWFKPGPYLDATAGTAAVQQTRLASALATCSTVLADFPTVIGVDVDSGWDNTTMLAPDLLHPNDKGHWYIAYVIERMLLATLFFRQGLNQLTSINDGSYVSPVPAFAASGAAAPSAPTGVAVVAGNQVNVTWTRAADGGASLTGQPIQASSDGGTTWTTVATAAANVSAYTIISGLTTGTAYIIRVGATNAVGTTYSSATGSIIAGAPPVVYVADSFNVADTTTPPVTPTGGFTWAATNSATLSIASQQMVNTQPTNTESDTWVDDGHADGTFQLTLATTVKSNGLMFRASATTDGYIFWVNESTKNLQLARRTAVATFTQVVTGIGTAAAGDVLKVIANGTALTLFKNGVQVGTFTDSVNTAKTRSGHWRVAELASVAFDDFSHSSLIA